MMRCLQATQALSEQMEQPLGLRQNIALQIHLLTCPHCRQFKQNCQQLRKLMNTFRQEDKSC